MKPRSIAEATRQCLEWLHDHHPHERVIQLLWVDQMNVTKDYPHGYYGDSWAQGDQGGVRLSKRACRTRSIAVETMIHEWAHLMTWDESGSIDHGDTFWITYGRIYHHWYDKGGREESSDY